MQVFSSRDTPSVFTILGQQGREIVVFLIIKRTLTSLLTSDTSTFISTETSSLESFFVVLNSKYLQGIRSDTINPGITKFSLKDRQFDGSSGNRVVKSLEEGKEEVLISRSLDLSLCRIVS